MRLLDLFCGAGGASVGYARAGFEVVGVDHRRQPNYPYDFVRADALTFDLGGFDAIHASPPCQAWSRAANLAEPQGGTRSRVDLVAPIRARLAASGRPYVIENVPGAPVEGVFLCGSTFGLRARRHRIFESNVWLGAAGPCLHARQGRPVGVYGSPGGRQVAGVDRRDGRFVRGGVTALDRQDGADALGIDWPMSWHELTEAVPPAFTEHLGRQLAAILGAVCPT